MPQRISASSRDEDTRRAHRSAEIFTPYRFVTREGAKLRISTNLPKPGNQQVGDRRAGCRILSCDDAVVFNRKGGPRLVGPLVISAASHHGFCFSSRGLAARQLESPNPLRQAARGRIEGGLPAEESASLTLGWKPGNFWQQTYQLNSIAALRCAAAISSSSARLSTWASWSRSRALPGIPRV